MLAVLRHTAVLVLALLLVVVAAACGGGNQIADTPNPEAKVVADEITRAVFDIPFD